MTLLQATQEDQEIRMLREEINRLERELLENIKIERERHRQLILEQQISGASAPQPLEIAEEDDDDEDMRKLKEEILRMVLVRSHITHTYSDTIFTVNRDLVIQNQSLRHLLHQYQNRKKIMESLI